MTTKRILITLLITAVLSACAVWHEISPVGENKPPAASTNNDAGVAAAPKTAAEDNANVAKLPHVETITPPAESASGSSAVAPLGKNKLEETPPPGVESPAPAPAPTVMPMPIPVPTENMAQLRPPKAMTVVADRTPREFTVTVGMKNPSDPFYGRGSDMAFVIDGTQGKELVLTRGVTYIIHVRTNLQHDFYFTTSPKGRGAGTLTNGITGQFTYWGDVSITPGPSTPDTIYYACRNHAFMGGKIHVANAGDKVSVGGEEMTLAPLGGDERPVVNSAEVKQKLSFAEMMISSPSAKRVSESTNTQAKTLYVQAKQQIDNAHAALNIGDNAGAMQSVNESLRLMSEADRLVPAETDQDYYKAKYKQIFDQLQGFVNSYQNNFAHGVKPKPGKALDKPKFDDLMKEARGLVAKGQYDEGVKRLEAANDMVVAALGAMLESQTVVYDKNFATSKEEYDYELARYDSYEELIPLAIEQRKPLEQTVTMMHALTSRAKEIHDEGVTLAGKGDHKQAVLALQAATERLQRALRLAGVQ